MKKCRIQRYDPAVTESPLEFITLGDFEIPRNDDLDDLGVAFFLALSTKCWESGFLFKFYSMSTDENFDYDVVVT